MASWPYNTSRWRKLREAKLAETPLCEICARRDEIEEAVAVDHFTPISAGGSPFPELSGLLSLCLSCHNEKTASFDKPGGQAFRRRFKGFDANGNAGRLRPLEDNPRVSLVEGDAMDQAALETAIAGQDVVYANLAGDMGAQARVLVAAMKKTGVKRLIFVSSMGVYGEVPGETYGAILDPYRESVQVIEASDLDYTIIRPAWLNDRDEIAYGITRKDEAFANKDATVSRQSVADLIVKLATTPGLETRQSLGVHKASGAPFRGLRPSARALPN